MKFTNEYPKLKWKVFTTIRKNIGFYKVGKTYTINSLNQYFKAEVISLRPIKKEEITEELAYIDANCSKGYLIDMLEKWYGKAYNDYILIILMRK